ncbi:hypothetical protein ABZ876_27455 [Streptomyces sp. NPDC046931]|uniref:hypothetical protein n=1 Tax=Streptomyces sp. NPDC046931 TaxID=3154806 RepID=UPI0033DD1606
MVNEQSGVPVGKRLTYRTGDASASYAVTFQHRRDAFLLDLGSAGAYHRFIGDVTVEHTHAGRTDIARGRTLWQLLHFGPRAAKGAGRSCEAPKPVPLLGRQA